MPENRIAREVRAIAHRIDVAARELEDRMPGRARKMRADANRLRELVGGNR